MRAFICVIWWLLNISRVFHFAISIKWKNEISLTSFFLLLINVIVIKYVAETLISSPYPVDTGHKLNVHKTFRRRLRRFLNVLCTFNLRPVPTELVDICDMRSSISYFDQILGKRESQTRQEFNSAILWFWNFFVYTISRKWSKIAKIAKFNTFKAYVQVKITCY